MGPFHEGELEVQRRAGVAAGAARVGRIIRSTIPEVARGFAAERRFAILGAADSDGRVWASLLRGEPGFLTVPADDRLRLNASLPPGDPLAAALAVEADLGVLLIDPLTRRRMRLNGRSHPLASGLELATREVYSNCPKYIHPREASLARGADAAGGTVERASALTPPQAARLAAADTLFLASRHPSAGADVSHRGGDPGFARVAAPDRLLIPDYAGNTMFNTLGNLVADPRAGVLVWDFETGDTLQLAGRAAIVWHSDSLSSYPGAQRLVEFAIDAVVERVGAIRAADRPAAVTARNR